jgi:hypothetical protein
LDAVKKCLVRNVSAFRKARVVAIRQKSFDETTAMLGQPQPGRKGYDDWRGKDVKGLVLVTVEVVESVTRWREAALAAMGKLGLRNECVWMLRNITKLPPVVCRAHPHPPLALAAQVRGPGGPRPAAPLLVGRQEHPAPDSGRRRLRH